MLTILDIGCRYGVFPLFKNIYEQFNYVGVDADIEEITRLKKKYKDKKIQFFTAFLGDCSENIDFHIYNHEGFNSSKAIDKNSLWIQNISPNQTQIQTIKSIRSETSGDWISKNIDQSHKIILKLDIEGGELDFLNGLDVNLLEKIDAMIIEMPFDNPNITESNFYTVGSYLDKNGYWLAGLDLEKTTISRNCEYKDLIPTLANSMFLKNSYKPINNNGIHKPSETMCEVLFALGQDLMLFECLQKIKPHKIRKFRLFNNYKFLIGHKLNRLKKLNQNIDDNLSEIFETLFDEKLPDLSNFNQSDFFNPV